MCSYAASPVQVLTTPCFDLGGAVNGKIILKQVICNKHLPTTIIIVVGKCLLHYIEFLLFRKYTQPFAKCVFTNEKQ